MDRGKIIIKTSLIGILTNVLLVAVKSVIGLASGSIAIVLDAVNNFSDALTSIITIIGTKLAQRAPDKKHPYGYGRIEYITTVVVSLVILTAGGTAVKESIETIITRAKATYSWNIVVILLIAVVAKYFMATYTIKKGKEIEAHSLIASGRESLFDGVLSVGTLIAAFLSVTFGVSIEGWLGAVIAIGIIKAGGEMLGETISVIIGVRSDKSLSGKLKKMIANYPGVNGVYDVILHNYGPSQHIGSVHIEVDEDMNAKQIHVLTRQIIREVYDAMEVIITIGIYSSVKSDPVAIDMRHEVAHIIQDYPDIMQMHGFYKDKDIIGFDLVIDFKVDASKIIKDVENRLKKQHPEYRYLILLDLDYSD